MRATELWEKQQQNSENSSIPPSKDNPYVLATTEESKHYSESKTAETETEQKQIDRSLGKEKKKNPRGSQENNQGVKDSDASNRLKLK